MRSKIINLRCNCMVIEKADKVARELGLSRSAAIRLSIVTAERVLLGSEGAGAGSLSPAGSQAITKDES